MKKTGIKKLFAVCLTAAMITAGLTACGGSAKAPEAAPAPAANPEEQTEESSDEPSETSSDPTTESSEDPTTETSATPEIKPSENLHSQVELKT